MLGSYDSKLNIFLLGIRLERGRGETVRGGGKRIKEPERKVSASEFKETLRAVQEHKGWSVRDLASELHVSDQMAERLLQGKSVPVPSVRRRLPTWADKELSR